MKDEEFVYKSDVRDKAITARSARKTRTHCGKGGRVRFPSDNLSKKELQKMNGEVKSYRLNSPMNWAEFKSMPDDLKVVYIQALRNKYDVSNKHLSIALGWPHASLDKVVKKLGLNTGKRGNYAWDKEGFYAWASGVNKLSTPVIEEAPAEDPIQEPVISSEELEVYAEDDLPIEEQDHQDVLRLIEECCRLDGENKLLQSKIDEVRKTNEELMAVHEKDKQEITWLRNECDSIQNALRMREAQLEIVQLIFGGKNNG